MRMTKKYYFSRKETEVVYADNEDDARQYLADHYIDSESFMLDDVMDVIETTPGEYTVVGR